jgi:hypothetical protein
MKALSIKQPWAWLVCAGYKDVENRTWRIGRKPAPGFARVNYDLEWPARIYVHAGKEADHDCLITEGGEYGNLIRFPIEKLTLGAIIGEVTITDCVRKSPSPWFLGPYGFVLADPKLYDKPIPYPGRLGFFEVPDEAIRQSVRK